MKKLSKSELSTPEMEERARVAGEILKSTKSQHFAVGTYVLVAGKGRGLITALGGRVDGPVLLRVQWEDSSEEEIAPIALNR